MITYAYLLLLVAGTVIPLNTSTALNDNYTMSIRWDYLLHALVYLPLPLLLALGIRKGSGEHIVKPGPRELEPLKTGAVQYWIRIIIYSLLITVLLECLQLVIPYRAFNINDLLANGVGAVLGFLLLAVLSNTRLFSG